MGIGSESLIGSGSAVHANNNIGVVKLPGSQHKKALGSGLSLSHLLDWINNSANGSVM